MTRTLLDETKRIAHDAVALEELLWQACVLPEKASWRDPRKPPGKAYLNLDLQAVSFELEAQGERGAKGLLTVLERRSKPPREEGFFPRVPIRALGIHALVAMASADRPLIAADVNYHVREAIRKKHDARWRPRLASDFHSLCRKLNTFAEQMSTTTMSSPLSPGKHSKTAAYSEIFEVCEGATVAPGTFQVFLQTCRLVGYLLAARAPGCVFLQAGLFDAEFLISHLFGMPTSIRGLDELFGGGGPILTRARDTKGSMRGRVLVIRGRYGTGKSILAGQLCAEVARKGGAAYAVTLEQTPMEWEYMLRSMHSLPEDDSVRVWNEIPPAEDSQVEDRGCLVVVGGSRKSFSALTGELARILGTLKGPSLKLVCIDSLNGLEEYQSSEQGNLSRSRVFGLLQEIVETGTNLLLVCEARSEEDWGSHFEDSIADIVIKLGEEVSFGYAQRLLELTKCRLQREQRGRHSYSIVPGHGFRVLPSSAAVRSRIQRRAANESEAPAPFGEPSIDSVLGLGAIHVGDMVLLHGPAGTKKSQVGYRFLLHNAGMSAYQPEDALLISVGGDAQLLRSMLAKTTDRLRGSGIKDVIGHDQLRVAVTQKGYIGAGAVYQRIEDAFTTAEREGRRIGRVMIDNVQEWDLHCPLLRGDPLFGDTLCELLSRRGATALLVYSNLGVQPLEKGPIGASLFSEAVCCVRFYRDVQSQGEEVLVGVERSRNAGTAGDLYELVPHGPSYCLKASSSPVRLGHDGRIVPLDIRLYLHADTKKHVDYNESLSEMLSTLYGRDVELRMQHLLPLTPLGNRTAPAESEVAVMQLDEYQVNTIGKSEGRAWKKVGCASVGIEASNMLDRMKRVAGLKRVQDGHVLHAVPYYSNLSCLAFRSDKVDGAWSSWEEICAEADKRRKSKNERFFDFPKGNLENWNCLFLELLASTLPVPADRGACKLVKWISDEEGFGRAADWIMRLCRPYVPSFDGEGQANAMGSSSRGPRSLARAGEVDHSRPVVWRHWYSTLERMMSQMTSQARQTIRTRCLPGEVSTTGDWYLGVPWKRGHSATAEEIIRQLTSRAAEMERYRLGIGLPTRKEYYCQEREKSTPDDLTWPEIEARTEKIHRSGFHCYEVVSPVLADAIGRLMLNGGGSRRGRTTSIENVRRGMVADLGILLRDGAECGACRGGPTQRGKE